MAKLGPDQRPGFKRVDVIEGYNQWASTYDRDPNPLIALEERVTLGLVGDVRGKRVLDLGCGTGRYCVLLAKRGAEVIGIDPSPDMLERAKQKITSDCQVELYFGTIENMAFPNEHFDLVLSALTLNHLPTVEPSVREAARVLKHEGRMVISDVHPFWPVSGHDYTEFFDGSGQEYRIPVYPHLFSEYWSLFEKVGLHVDDVRELVIDSQLIEQYPSLVGFKDIPLAMVIVCTRQFKSM
jgi:ubiquinone/menaquinone biosynthesis C-methylase UbiE